MKTLIDFIIDMGESETLAKDAQAEIVKAESTEVLQKWFSSKGYEVSQQECIRLIENKSKFEGERVGPAY